jgi:hypothetical protein
VVEIGPSLSQKYLLVQEKLEEVTSAEGGFLSLALRKFSGEIVSENIYWYPDSTGDYSGLQHMPASKLQVKAKKVSDGKIEVTLTNPKGAPLAFFNRLSLIDSKTGKRELPVFYSDNYISVLAGETRKVLIDYTKLSSNANLKLSIRGWNLTEHTIDIQSN